MFCSASSRGWWVVLLISMTLSTIGGDLVFDTCSYLVWFFARPNPDPSFLLQYSSCDFVVLQHFVSGHNVWENTQKAVTLILPADCFFMSTFAMSVLPAGDKKNKTAVQSNVHWALSNFLKWFFQIPVCFVGVCCPLPDTVWFPWTVNHVKTKDPTVHCHIRYFLIWPASFFLGEWMVVAAWLSVQKPLI